MRNPGGYATLTVEGKVAKELDTFTCCHCQRVIHVKPRSKPEDLGGLCKQCMKLICPSCVSHGGCTPWEKQMDAAERADRLYRALRGDYR